MNLEFFTNILGTVSNMIPENDLLRKLLLLGIFVSIVLGIYRNLWMILFFALLAFMLFGTKEYFSVYDNDKKHIYSALLQEDELIFQDDTMLYHYVTPITYLGRDSFDPIGYRDLIGCDILNSNFSMIVRPRLE